MAAHFSVCVLLPDGHRRSVKVTSHTSVLQILEEVCNKQQLDPTEFDLKHHRKVLDTSTTVLFAGLPNNAQLELVKCSKKRQETFVTVAIQLEGGQRLLHNFHPNTSLWDIVQHWKITPEKEYGPGEQELVCIYTRREVCGEGSLRSTSLRGLGLTGGSAVLRLIWRSKGTILHQANVSAPLPHKKPQPNIEAELPRVNLTAQAKQQVPNLHQQVPNEQHSEMEIETEPETLGLDGLTKIMSKEVEEEDEEEEEEEEEEDFEEKGPNPLEKLTIIGERNAIVFDRNQMTPQHYVELPDDFYDVTVDDMRSLMKDLTQQRKKLEEAPLLTRVQRDTEHTDSVSEKVERHQHTVIRIQFPDYLVLQGTFHALETVQNVAEFISQFLEDPHIDFYLFTAPPKRILPLEARLVDLDCVPAAVVHFGSHTTMQHYLSSGTRDNLSILAPPKDFSQTPKDRIKKKRVTSGNPKVVIIPKWFQVRK